MTDRPITVEDVRRTIQILERADSPSREFEQSHVVIDPLFYAVLQIDADARLQYCDKLLARERIDMLRRAWRDGRSAPHPATTYRWICERAGIPLLHLDELLRAPPSPGV